MYTEKSLKKLFNKYEKKHKSLTRALIICNDVVVNKFNEEELNEVKEYVAYKIDLLNDIMKLINNFLEGDLRCNIEELAITLDYYKKQFNDLSKEARLSRLQQIYTRKVNEEVIGL